jgi:hypothetical protein
MSRVKMTMKTKVLICALVGAAAVFGQEPVSLSYSGDAEHAYQAVLTRMKVDGLDIKSASKDAGIETALVITGKRKQTGVYMKITFIPDGAGTKVRIAVYESHRLSLLVVEPWSDAQLSDNRSKAEAFTLKGELGW